MTYGLSLSVVTLFIGGLIFLVHLPGLIVPRKMMIFARAFPRHYYLGVILTALAGFWLTALTLCTDLGELSPYRVPLAFAWVIGTLLQIIFVSDFLAVRGLAMLMLLAVAVMLDAAFLVDSPSRYVITIMAYLFAVVGIFFVSSPYLARDAILFATHTERRFRLICAGKTIFGLLLLFLGYFVY